MKAKRPVRLALVRTRPNEAVVGLLKDMTQRARKGEIRGVVIAATLRGGSVSSCYSFQEGGVAESLYALDIVRARLVRGD